MEHINIELFVTVFAALFSVVNPLGAVPVFISMTTEYSLIEKRRVAKDASVYFILILMTFFLFGSAILTFFGISLSALTVAGGLIIILNGFALINGKFAESRTIDKKIKDEAKLKEDISFTPLAMPLLSGPGSISLLISLYATHALVSDKVMIAVVIVLNGLLVYFILRSSSLLFKALGRSGLRAITRIMGFLVLSIGIQYVANGVLKFLSTM